MFFLHHNILKDILYQWLMHSQPINILVANCIYMTSDNVCSVTTIMIYCNSSSSNTGMFKMDTTIDIRYAHLFLIIQPSFRLFHWSEPWDPLSKYEDNKREKNYNSTLLPMKSISALCTVTNRFRGSLQNSSCKWSTDLLLFNYNKTLNHLKFAYHYGTSRN